MPYIIMNRSEKKYIQIISVFIALFFKKKPGRRRKENPNALALFYLHFKVDLSFILLYDYHNSHNIWHFIDTSARAYHVLRTSRGP